MKYINRQIIFLSQFFYPEVNSTAQLLTELAVELSKNGMSITVYTNRNIYLEEKRPLKREVYSNVQIIRLLSLGLNKDRKYSRIIDSLLFSLSCFIYLTFNRHRCPLFIVTEPPFLPVIGWLQKKVRKRKYVMLLYDIHPDMSIKLGWLKSDGFVARAWDFINRRVYHDADVIVTIGSDMKKIVDNKLRSNNTKVKIIHNWADGDFIKPILKSKNWFCNKYELNDKFVLLYSGSIGLHHELGTLFEAIAQCRHLSNLEFVIIGDGSQKKELVDLAETLRLNNIKFLPYQPREYLPYSRISAECPVL